MKDPDVDEKGEETEGKNDESGEYPLKNRFNVEVYNREDEKGKEEGFTDNKMKSGKIEVEEIEREGIKN